LSREEAVSYVAGRIRIAGGIGSQVFTRDAVELMHLCARGIPRTISVLADNALVGGFAAGVRPVPSRFVREVSTDFDIAAPEARPAAPKASPAPPKPAAPPAVLIPIAEPARAATQPGGGLLGRAPNEGTKAHGAEVGDGVEQSSMFGTFAPRRKRFSFFWS
jgi:hypothetical protein